MLGFNRWQLFKGLALAVGTSGVVSLALIYFIPAPPSTVTMATGFKGASVEYYGRRYREIFARSHVQLELRETDGAVENIQLLQDPCRSGRIDGLLMQVQIAVEGLQFVQKLYQVLETAAEPINRHAAIMLIRRAVASFSSLSKPGRFSRPLEPEMPASS